MLVRILVAGWMGSLLCKDGPSSNDEISEPPVLDELLDGGWIDRFSEITGSPVFDVADNTLVFDKPLKGMNSPNPVLTGMDDPSDFSI